ncbi:hypothetical protein [Lactobacillus taiwanensis]|uniref:hypothetical protein n=1 Tax=Lactobacillus taiwanensis TaxID=508451 RepID=UPI00248C21EB|nr:hypothetical protein [Lactobacillus taiwanensis]
MKKYFIFLGAPGVIYYSWLLALIFVAFIIGYESNKSISYPAIILGAIFVVIVIYTWLNSYFQKETDDFWVKLPYRQKFKLQSLEIKCQWKAFVIYKAKSKINTYLFLALKRKKK